MSLLDSLTRPRTLAVLLALSLAINLFLAGTIAGRMGARHHLGAHPPPLLGLGGPGFESGFRFIPHEGRERLRDVLQERHPGLRDEHNALRTLHREIAEELRKDAPDRALIEGRFKEIRRNTLAMEESLQASFLDTALAMDPIERGKMLDAMLEHHGRAPHHGPKHGPAGTPQPFEVPLPPPGSGAGPQPGE